MSNSLIYVKTLPYLTEVSTERISECITNISTNCQQEGFGRQHHALPLDLVCILDRSGSMGGDKMNNLKHAMKFIVGRLGERDRLSIVDFGDDAKILFALQTMTIDNKNGALNCIEALGISGGTNIYYGLKVGWDVLENRGPTKSGSNSAIFLLTDGQDEMKSEMSRLIQSKIKPSGTLLFAYGLGNDHNSGFMSDVAKQSNGKYVYIDKIDTVVDIFAGSLGILHDEYLANVTVTIKVKADVIISKINTGNYIYTKDSTNNTITISYHHLFRDETRNIQLVLSLPAIANEDKKYHLYEVSATGFQNKNGSLQQIQTPIKIQNIKRIKPAQLNPNPIYNPHVTDQNNRVIVIETLESALLSGDKNQIPIAIETIKKTISDFKDSKLTYPLTLDLIEDLEEALVAVESQPNQFINYGKPIITNLLDIITTERSIFTPIHRAFKKYQLLSSINTQKIGGKFKSRKFSGSDDILNFNFEVEVEDEGTVQQPTVTRKLITSLINTGKIERTAFKKTSQMTKKAVLLSEELSCARHELLKGLLQNIGLIDMDPVAEEDNENEDDDEDNDNTNTNNRSNNTTKEYYPSEASQSLFAMLLNKLQTVNSDSYNQNNDGGGGGGGGDSDVGVEFMTMDAWDFLKPLVDISEEEKDALDEAVLTANKAIELSKQASQGRHELLKGLLQNIGLIDMDPIAEEKGAEVDKTGAEVGIVGSQDDDKAIEQMQTNSNVKPVIIPSKASQILLKILQRKLEDMLIENNEKYKRQQQQQQQQQQQHIKNRKPTGTTSRTVVSEDDLKTPTSDCDDIVERNRTIRKLEQDVSPSKNRMNDNLQKHRRPSSAQSRRPTNQNISMKNNHSTLQFNNITAIEPESSDDIRVLDENNNDNNNSNRMIIRKLSNESRINRHKLNEQKKTITEQQSTIDNLQNKVESYRKELKTLKNKHEKRLGALRQELETNKLQVESIVEEKEIMRSLLEHEKETNNNLETQLSNIHKDMNRELTTRINEIIANETDMRTKLSQQDQLIQKLHYDNECLNIESNEMSQATNALKQILYAVRRGRHQLLSDIDEHTAEWQTFHDNNTDAIQRQYQSIIAANTQKWERIDPKMALNVHQLLHDLSHMTVAKYPRPVFSSDVPRNIDLESLFTSLSIPFTGIDAIENTERPHHMVQNNPQAKSPIRERERHNITDTGVNTPYMALPNDSDKKKKKNKNKEDYVNRMRLLRSNSLNAFKF
eukprot:gene4712-9353_t